MVTKEILLDFGSFVKSFQRFQRDSTNKDTFKTVYSGLDFAVKGKYGLFFRGKWYQTARRAENAKRKTGKSDIVDIVPLE